MTTDQFITIFNLSIKRYLTWWFYGMAVIEIAALVLRAVGIHVQLVSQVAREIAFKGLPTMAYFMAGMAAHWFITWHRVPWSDNVAHVLGVWFWGCGVAYLLADIFDPNYIYWPVRVQWLRYPPVVAIFGGFNAFVCFPQRSLWYPGEINDQTN